MNNTKDIQQSKTNQKKKKFCINCKIMGHSDLTCIKPITSYGIILFKIKPEHIKKELKLDISDEKKDSQTEKKSISTEISPLTEKKSTSIENIIDITSKNIKKCVFVSLENMKKYMLIEKKKYALNEGILIRKKIFGLKTTLPENVKYNIKYLMICRKHSISFLEFIRGKYILKNKKKLQFLFNNMTFNEKIVIVSSKTFDDLWNVVWGDDKYVMSFKKKHKYEYSYSALKFNVLKKSNFSKYNLFSLSKDLEWGFPKGKKNIKELKLSCAIREFEEETGLSRSDFTVLKNFPPKVEEFKGSDGRIYNYIYYFGILNKYDINLSIDESNNNQKNEIGNIKWVSYEEAVQLIDKKEKKKRIDILTALHEHITSVLKK